MQILVGQIIDVSYNGAKYILGMDYGKECRVEAVGVDWIVLRDMGGVAYACAPGAANHAELLRILTR